MAQSDISNLSNFIPARSPAEDISALFSPEEARKASEILCKSLIS